MPTGVAADAVSRFPVNGHGHGPDEPDWFALDLIGKSPAFLQALRSLREWAKVDATVLLRGETGTGKELAARAIHQLSSRHGGPFVPLNCGALPDSLLEAELFGHVRGAFTDARQDGQGLIALAEGGVLFLDEVDSLSPRAQGAILRFVQDHSYRPVGGTRFKHGDVRLVAATNTDLEALSREGRFRQDLLFRLNLLTVALPPLREREGDVLLLAHAFVRRLCAQYRMQRELGADSIRALQCRRPWPGNVRELENAIHRCFLMSTGGLVRIEEADLCSAGDDFAAPLHAEESHMTLAEMERDHILRVVARENGRVEIAAATLGIPRSTLYQKLKAFRQRSQMLYLGLQPEVWPDWLYLLPL
jgi:transcriptional regulator with PAS, ATPase and Fis domain